MANVEPITVRRLDGARDLRRFLELPHFIYAGDPHWIPPLHRDVRKLVNPRKNPFFEHGDAAFWIAWRGMRPVGRISAQVNRLHLDRYRDATGNFGFLEAIDDRDVFDALLTTAEDWLRARGMGRALGPYSLTINDDIGVLVSGFDTPPMALMGHSPRYYSERLETAGYRKAKDVFAFRVDGLHLDPPTVERIRRAGAYSNAEGRISLRTIDMTHFEREMRLLLALYNDAWMNNWGFLPVTDSEVRELITAIKPVIRADLINYAMIDGKAVGFLAAIPNVNEILAELNGRLLPFGWAKLWWRLRWNPPKSARVILAGIDSDYRNSARSGAVMTLLIGKLIEKVLAGRIPVLEASWVLEDNKGSIGISGLFGKVAKTYRIYERNLVDPEPRAAPATASLRHSPATI